MKIIIEYQYLGTAMLSLLMVEVARSNRVGTDASCVLVNMFARTVWRRIFESFNFRDYLLYFFGVYLDELTNLFPYFQLGYNNI